MGTNNIINPNALTERELLIQVHTKVENLDKKFDKLSEQEIENRVKIAALETKAKVHGSVFGLVGSLIISLITKIFIK